MERDKRKTGLNIIGDVTWGTHFCQFYQTKADLIDILVPYFKAGLENNEFCMWITAEPLNAEEAKEAMRGAMPGFDRYLKSGQIEILPYTEWYLKDGACNLQGVLNAWIDKLNQALTKGYDGMRVTGNTAWLEKKDWRNSTDYEEAINNVIGEYQMMVICTYSLDRCGASEVIDVISNHQFALVRREGRWELIESSERKQAEEALRESEQKYRSLFEQMLNGFAYCKILVDENNRPIDFIYLEVNDAFERITGLRREDVIGRKVTEAIPGTSELHPGLFSIYGKVALTGEPTQLELYFEPLGIWLTISVYSPQRGYFVAVFDNITERKRAENALKESEQNFRNSLDNSPLGIRIVSAEGEFLYANRAILNIYGYSSIKELKAVPSKQRYTAKSYAEHQERKGKRKLGKPVPSHYEISIVRKDGEVRHLAVFRKEIIWSGETHFQVLYQDVTERKRVENERKHLLRELEEKTSELEQIIHIASHDMRTPLVNIQGFTRELEQSLKQVSSVLQDKDTPLAIKEKLAVPIDKDIPDAVRYILSSSAKIDSLLSGLLRFSRLGRTTLTIEELDMNKLMADVIQTFEFYLRKTGVTLEVGNLPSCPGDETQVNEVFSNLIDNALKFLDPNRTGIIRVSGRKKAGQVIYCVEDNGIGIAPEHQEKVFEVFHCLDSSTASGQGLGLTIIRMILERHFGKVWVESEAGKGSKFFVSLPSAQGETSTNMTC